MKFDVELEMSFGPTAYFANHPTEEKFAFAWLIKLRENRVSWQDAKAQLIAFMNAKGFDQDHQRLQIETAKRMLGPWLSGPID